jgi:DNA-binding MarR family transcriptional regulator
MEQLEAIQKVQTPLELITKEIARILDQLEKASTAAHGRQSETLCPSDNTNEPDDHLADVARSIIRERKRRSTYFEQLTFSDPMWEILLDLFVSEVSRRRISVSSACLASDVAPTTALRYIAHLTKMGVLARANDHSDGRRTFLNLTPVAQGAMRSYLSDIYRGRFEPI